MDLTQTLTQTVHSYGDTSAKYRLWAVDRNVSEVLSERIYVVLSERIYVESVSDAIKVWHDQDAFNGYMAAGFEENLSHGTDAPPDWCEWYDPETGKSFEEFLDRDHDEDEE